MATTRPATPAVPARRLLLVLDVDAGVELLVVDGSVVERVVRGVVGMDSGVLRPVEGARLEVGVVAGVEVVEALPVGGCVGAPVAVGVAAGAEAADVVAAADVGVSGSSVRETVAEPAESSAGTVTSGTVRTGRAAPDPTGTLPETGPRGVVVASPEVVGRVCPAAPPQAANSSPAMP